MGISIAGVCNEYDNSSSLEDKIIPSLEGDSFALLHFGLVRACSSWRWNQGLCMSGRPSATEPRSQPRMSILERRACLLWRFTCLHHEEVLDLPALYSLKNFFFD
jgi:hypothetical protein